MHPTQARPAAPDTADAPHASTQEHTIHGLHRTLLTGRPLATAAGDLFTPLLARGTGRLPWVVPEEAKPVKPVKPAPAPKPEPVVQVAPAPAATPVAKPPLFKRLGEQPMLCQAILCCHAPWWARQCVLSALAPAPSPDLTRTPMHNTAPEACKGYQ
jgi:hypothetical protein